jgi:hypothetical protein
MNFCAAAAAAFFSTTARGNRNERKTKATTMSIKNYAKSFEKLSFFSSSRVGGDGGRRRRRRLGVKEEKLFK